MANLDPFEVENKLPQRHGDTKEISGYGPSLRPGVLVA